MKVAILMSTYNGSKYLDEQLGSIARQSVIDNIIVYIRDDGSVDTTFEIIEKWKKKINIVLIKGKNAGPAQSFWTLLKADSIIADYYFFCDQDDIWDENKIELQVAELEAGACLSFCNCRLVDGQGKLIKTERVDREPTVSFPALFVCCLGQGCSMAFTKELRDFIVKKDPKCLPMHDIIVFLYALSYGKIKWIQTPLFSYRMHGANVVAKRNKGIIKRVMTTYWNWKNSSKYSMATVAAELLEKGDSFSDDDRSYLIAMSNYRESKKNKLIVLKTHGKLGNNKAAIRSYVIRVMLNLL